MTKDKKILSFFIVGVVVTLLLARTYSEIGDIGTSILFQKYVSNSEVFPRELYWWKINNSELHELKNNLEVIDFSILGTILSLDADDKTADKRYLKKLANLMFEKGVSIQTIGISNCIELSYLARTKEYALLEFFVRKLAQTPKINKKTCSKTLSVYFEKNKNNLTMSDLSKMGEILKILNGAR